jgi:hypothetical protein
MKIDQYLQRPKNVNGDHSISTNIKIYCSSARPGNKTIFYSTGWPITELLKDQIKLDYQ